MVGFNDKSFEAELKCDFPARESFKKALLSRLRSLDGETLREASFDESEIMQEGVPEIRELSDSDLELVAAAQGDFFTQDDCFTG